MIVKVDHYRTLLSLLSHSAFVLQNSNVLCTLIDQLGFQFNPNILWMLSIDYFQLRQELWYWWCGTIYPATFWDFEAYLWDPWYIWFCLPSLGFLLLERGWILDIRYWDIGWILVGGRDHQTGGAFSGKEGKSFQRLQLVGILTGAFSDTWPNCRLLHLLVFASFSR